MRILHLCHYLPPETHGGTQGYVLELASLQAARGHAVGAVAGARKPGTRGEVEASDEGGVAAWRILRDPETELFSGDLGSERIGRLVEERLSAFAPDVVHVHHWQALTRDLVRRARRLGFPTVLTLHDQFTTCPRFFRMPDARSFCDAGVTFRDCAVCVSADLGGMPLPELEGVLSQRFDEFQAELAAAGRVLTVSEAQRAFLASLPGFDASGVHVLPIGIRMQEPTAGFHEEAPGRLRLVNWAGLDPRKGIHLLLEAVARTERPAAFEVHLHGREGDPEYMTELRDASRGLDVRFHGPFEDGERAEFAALYDLAVFPFLAFETYGLVVDEALRSGLPVVTSDHGAPPERLGERGLTFPNGDAAALARLLDELLASPERVAALRRGAHRAHDLEDHERALREHYEAVTRAAGTRR